MPSLFPCSPVIRECSWKKTQLEKKQTKWDVIGLVPKGIAASVFGKCRLITLDSNEYTVLFIDQIFMNPL